jgi:hypothetical protein
MLLLCYNIDFWTLRNGGIIVGFVENGIKLIQRSAKISCSFLNIQQNLRLENGIEWNYNWINKPYSRRNFRSLIYLLNINIWETDSFLVFGSGLKKSFNNCKSYFTYSIQGTKMSHRLGFREP